MEKGKDALNLDPSTADGFCTFFRKLEQNDDVVRFFDRKEYFTVHGQHAIQLAQRFLKTLTAVKRLGSKSAPLESLCINQKLFAQILRHLLVETNHRVEVWEGSGRSWQISQQASSGNLQAFEDVLYRDSDMDDTPTLMAITLRADRYLSPSHTLETPPRTVGVAAVDTVKNTLMLDQFEDDEQLSTLEALMTHYGCKECVVPEKLGKDEERLVSQLFERCGILRSDRPRSDFAAKDCEEEIRRLVRPNEQARIDLSQPAAVSALICVVRYLALSADASNYGLYRPVEPSLQLFMRLDAGASASLNLFPTQGESPKSNTHLYGLLNHCCTGMGSRTLRRWIKQPMVSAKDIRHRQDLLQAFVEDILLVQTLRTEVLKGIPDLERLAKKFVRGKANLQDCVRVYQLVLLLPSISGAFSEVPDSSILTADFVEPLKAYAADFERFSALIEQTVDLEELENDHYCIDVSFSEELKELKTEKDKLYNRMSHMSSKVASNLDLDSSKVHFENNKTYGHVFRITRKDEKVLRNRDAYKTLSTNKDGVRFTTPTLSKLNTELKELTSQYEAVQSNVVQEVLEIASSYAPLMEDLAGLIADMDTALSLAHVIVNSPIPFTRPEIVDADQPRVLQLLKSRHPCVEVQEGVSFIPNNIDMSQENGTFHIITGPNMGGKSTFIRQVGVVVLMAQMGCFVPCEHAKISLCDRILTRVGAADSQLRGVSTFMAEMTETATILKSATPRSLLIVDELGRGTSTYDGFGLAWAISEDIAKRIGAFCLFATHFHELTALSRVIPTVNNFHVTAVTDHDSLTMLYQVQPGACDQSFGIHVAKLAKFPPEVVAMAEAKADELENSTGTKRSLDAPLEQPTKRIRAAEPVAVTRSLLKEFKALPLSQMAPVDAVRAVRELVQRAKQSDPTFMSSLDAQ